MSDRDRFVGEFRSFLDQNELTPTDKEHLLESLLRFLKKDKKEEYSTGDILEWFFTGDNIIFNQYGLSIPLDQINNDYVVDITLAEQVRFMLMPYTLVVTISMLGVDLKQLEGYHLITLQDLIEQLEPGRQ